MVDLSLRSILIYMSIVIFASGCGAPGGGDDSDSSSLTVTPESAISLAVDRSIVTTNESVTLSWSAPNLDSCSAAGDWSGVKATSGNELVGPLTSNSTFALTCYGTKGAYFEQVDVSVVSSLPPTVSLAANPANVIVGGSTVLTWTSTNATSCTATGDWSGNRNLNDTETLGPINTNRSYMLTCTGNGGTASDSVTVTASAPSAPIVNLSANPLNVAYDGSTILSWSTSNVDTCTASGSWTGSQNISGTRTESNLTSNQSYVLTCSGAGGTASDSITVNVSPPPAPAVNISANPLSIASGESTTLTWNSSNVDNCTASGDWSGSKGLSGSQTNSNLTSDKTYVLTCTGVGGSASDSISVSVITPPAPTLSFSASPTTVMQNATTSLTWSTTFADSCVASDGWTGNKGTSGSEDSAPLTADIQFTMTCTGPGGTVTQNVQVTVSAPPAPTLSFSANPQSVLQNDSTSLSWSASDATSCVASGGWTGNKGLTGNEDSGPLSVDTQFTLTCTGPGGTVVESVQVTVVLNGNGSATVSWTPPTNNTDGSPLTDLAGYKIYYGTAPGSYDEVVDINNPGMTSYVIENLLPGDWYFAMTAYNTSGIESSLTPELTKTIN